MQPRVQKLLYDALKAIEELNQFCQIFEGEFQNYKTNLAYKRAVEREFEIIGEAINKALKEDSSLTITDARKIISLRNYITHAYDSINDEMIWAIIVNNLPNLHQEIKSLLNK